MGWEEEDGVGRRRRRMGWEEEAGVGRRRRRRRRRRRMGWEEDDDNVHNEQYIR